MSPATWRGLFVALGLGAVITALLASAPAGRSQTSEGPVRAAPVLGVGDDRMVLMGARADGGDGGEFWAYRELPNTILGAVADGRSVPFGPVGTALRPDPQLAFLRSAGDGGWQIAETPLDREGRPSRGVAPNPRSARVLPRGGGFLLGRAFGSQADGDRVHVLARDPGERFRDLPAPSPDALFPADRPASGDAAEVLADGDGLGAVVIGGYEEGERTHVLVVPRGRERQEAVLHWDGEGWTREPISVPDPEGGTFEVIALDASGPQDAWLLARAATDGKRDLRLFRRQGAGSDARWEDQPLRSSPDGDPETAFEIADAEPLEGGLQQTLTAIDGHVWIDATVRQGDTAGDLTAHFDPQEGRVTGTWCDLTDADGRPRCDHALGMAFSRRAGYRSVALPGEGFGRRIISNPLRPGAGEDSNLGTYVSLEGTTFRRLPGGGGNGRRSAAFAAPDDGWLEGPVRVGSGAPPVSLRRWPVAVRSPFTAVAHQPGAPAGDLGSQALAVGGSGGVARFTPQGGWIREFLLSSSGAVTNPTLRGVAWPEAGRAYAVGDLGAMWLWRAETGLWERDPAAPVGFEANLHAVAFEPGDPARGYAAGRGGALLRYDKTWTQEVLPPDVATSDITSLAFSGTQAIAVAGDQVLVSDGGPWRVEAQVQELLAGVRGADVRLLVAAGLPDGGAVVAGRDIVLVRDRADAPWRFTDQPLTNLTAVAVAATRDGDRIRPVVSVVPALDYPPAEQIPEPDPNVPPPIIPPTPLPGDGYVLRETAAGWSDEQRQAYAGSGPDRPYKPDPVAAFDLSPDGEGWAVGGWSGEFDSAGRGSSGRNGNGRANRQRVQTAGVFRFGRSPAPAPGTAEPGDIPLDPAMATFAVAGHAQCERACADLAGQDLAPDRMLSATVARTAALASRPGGPRALLFTGGRTRPGAGRRQRDEEARRYADLLGGGGAFPVFPAVSEGDAEGGTVDAFRSAFGGAAAPLGSGAPGPAIEPLSGGAPGGASTHYAFSTQGPAGPVRVIVIDNSAGSLASSDPHQSPREPQRPWLIARLAEARDAGVPTVVVGSRDLDTRAVPALNVASDGDEIARILVEGGASAYFFDRPEENRRTSIPAGASEQIPAFGTGTLGYRSPLSATTDRPDALFGDSGFLLAQIDVSRRDPASNRAPVTVRLIPVIDDLALQAIDGTLLRRSRPSLFQGLGRRPEAGDRWGEVSGADGNPNPPGGDPYTALPPAPCLTAGCATRIAPEYSFRSSDPDIADFVRQDPASTNLRKPLIGTDDKVVTDGASALICPFNSGQARVSVSAGGLTITQQITVLAGSVQRPCGTRPIAPTRFTNPVPAAVAPPPPAAAAPPAAAPSSPPPVPPPPAPVVDVPEPAAKPSLKPTIPLAPVVPDPPAPPASKSSPRAQIPTAPPPPASGFARPIPPGGAVIRVLEQKREQEIAPESSQAFAAYDADEGPAVPVAPFIVGITVLAALAGATIRPGLRRRHRRAEHAVAAAEIHHDPFRRRAQPRPRRHQ